MKKAILTGILIFVFTSNLIAQIPSSGLVGYWPFSGNANDVSGNGNNGIVNAATLASDRFGIPNNAYNFNSGLDYISVPNSTTLQLTSYTISLWIRPNSSFGTGPNYHALFGKWGGTGNASYMVCLNPNGKARLVTHNGSSNTELIGNAVLAFNQWANIIVLQRQDTASIYINGVLDTTRYGMFIPATSNGNILIGANSISSSGDSFEGIIDEVLTYNRSLTSNEIQQIFSNGCGNLQASITSVGPTTFCNGSNVLVETRENYHAYQWQKNNLNIIGANSKSLTASNSGNYRCIVTSFCGIDTSNTIILTKIANDINTVVVTGALTFCAGDSVLLNSSNLTSGYSYQWYRNNIAINGATANTYYGKNPGTYKVVTKNNSNGCARISSNSATVAVNCRISNKESFIGNLDKNKGLLLYPNPTEGSFTLEINNEEIPDGLGVIKIINLNGQVVFEGTAEIANGLLKQEITLDQKFIAGLYFVKVITDANEIVGKVLLR